VGKLTSTAHYMAVSVGRAWPTVGNDQLGVRLIPSESVIGVARRMLPYSHALRLSEESYEDRVYVHQDKYPWRWPISVVDHLVPRVRRPATPLPAAVTSAIISRAPWPDSDSPDQAVVVHTAKIRRS
jgi:hypothetical protein